MAPTMTQVSLTPEQVTHLTNLHLLVEDAVMPTAIADFTNYGLVGEDLKRRVQKIEEFLKATNFSPDGKERIRERVRVYLRDADAPDETHLEVIRVTAACMTRVLTAAWVGALTKATSESKAGKWLRAATLDGSLLPRNNPEADRYFDLCLKTLGADTVTPGEGRALLVGVSEKARGELPQPLCDYLASCGVMVVR